MKTNLQDSKQKAISAAYASNAHFKAVMYCGICEVSSGTSALIDLQWELNKGSKFKQAELLKKSDTLIRQTSFFGEVVTASTVNVLLDENFDYGGNVSRAIADLLITVGQTMPKEDREKYIKYLEALNSSEGDVNE